MQIKSLNKNNSKLKKFYATLRYQSTIKVYLNRPPIENATHFSLHSMRLIIKHPTHSNLLSLACLGKLLVFLYFYYDIQTLPFAVLFGYHNLSQRCSFISYFLFQIFNIFFLSFFLFCCSPPLALKFFFVCVSYYFSLDFSHFL